MKINSLIFSYNRAQQLRLLLESIKQNSADYFNINIIYKSSNEEFQKGYEKLIDEQILPNINWIKQTDNFKQDVVNVLEQDSKYFCFFTDDDIIYEPIKLNFIDEIFNNEELFCFSLRLGNNVNFCYTMNQKQSIENHSEINGLLKWNWKQQQFDFGYPLSVDGHIFRTNDILKLTKKINFHNPNTYEGNLQIFSTFPKEIMMSFTKNVLVNTPNNIVNETHANLHSKSHGMTTKDLNDMYLNGEYINLNEMDFSTIFGCHQELPYKFKKQLQAI